MKKLNTKNKIAWIRKKSQIECYAEKQYHLSYLVQIKLKSQKVKENYLTNNFNRYYYISQE